MSTPTDRLLESLKRFITNPLLPQTRELAEIFIKSIEGEKEPVGESGEKE